MKERKKEKTFSVWSLIVGCTYSLMYYIFYVFKYSHKYLNYCNYSLTDIALDVKQPECELPMCNVIEIKQNNFSDIYNEKKISIVCTLDNAYS